jgi:inner membrane protein
MDNVTHAFIGAAMAECAVPRGAVARTRTVFLAAGVVAANAPDVDLLYTGLTEAPLGYLLHHRGHSHTLPGLAALGLLIWAGVRFLPWTRSGVVETERRWIVLIAVALLGHLLMDTANSYGTHLFYPFSSRWVYGDAVFVLEPWLWVILGAGLALNARRYWRALPAVLALAPLAAVSALGLLQVRVLMAMLGVAAVMAIATRAWDRQRRAAVILAVATTIFVLMPAVSRGAKTEARRSVLAMEPGEIVDIVSDANPGVPWCWSVLTLQKGRRVDDGAAEALVARRGTLSLLPGVWPAASCASAAVMRTRWGAGNGGDSVDLTSGAVVWHRRWRIDVEELRALYAANCRVRAWLQFGRVPSVANGWIADLRFEHPIGQNFTPMVIDSGGRGCPAFVTGWELPRHDLITDSSDSR